VTSTRERGATVSIGIDDLEPLATATGILGTGGGGNPRLGLLRLRSILEDPDYPDRVEVVDPMDVPDDASVVSVGGIGAPTISEEKFANGREELRSIEGIERLSGTDVDMIVAGEIGGANGIVPLVVSALSGLPVIDGDGMGRAFPELPMCTFFIYGAEPNYAVLTDERGNQVSYRDVDSVEQLERLARSTTVEMGGRAAIAVPLMDGAHVRRSVIRYSVSRALRLGRHVHRTRADGGDPVRTICDETGGTELFEGKIVDVFRRNEGGFARGSLELSSFEGSGSLTIEFQNEFLVARDEAGDPLAVVPDLICVVDKETANPITTGELRYGQRVRVLAIQAPDLLTTDRALAVIGPEAFGLDAKYRPIGGG